MADEETTAGAENTPTETIAPSEAQGASTTQSSPPSSDQQLLNPPTTNNTSLSNPPATQDNSSEQAAPLSISTQPIPAIARAQTEALGPATDSPITIAAPSNDPVKGPHLNISLMLTTGARHPYRIDEKYLRSRKVESRNTSGQIEPRELSGYQLKELIWIDWRSEWEPRPASPSSIRLIIMGRMIEDKSSLKDFPFSAENPNVVHMTVKPADLIDDDETGGKSAGKSGAARGRDAEERGAGCRCVIL